MMKRRHTSQLLGPAWGTFSREAMFTTALVSAGRD